MHVHNLDIKKGACAAFLTVKPIKRKNLYFPIQQKNIT